MCVCGIGVRTITRVVWPPTSKRLLGMGDSRFSFAMPDGNDAIVAIESVFFIGSSRATPDGMTSLVPSNPMIGDMPLPSSNFRCTAPV